MKVELYAYRDRKSGEYSMPFAQHNKETAKRYFCYLCKNSDNQEYAQDLELYKIGDYETERGIIFGHEPEYVSSYNGSEVI